jgi:hypothetical protein
MAELVLKQLTGDISEEEIKELSVIRSDLKISDQLFDELLSPAHLTGHFDFLNKLDKNASWETVKKAFKVKPYKLISCKNLLNAAAIIGAISIVAWPMLNKPLVPNKHPFKGTTYIPFKMQFNKGTPLSNIKKQKEIKQGSNTANILSPITSMPRETANKIYKKNKKKSYHNDICIDNAGMDTILKLFHRDKDYKVEYSEGIPPGHYTGIIDKSLPVDEIMQQVVTDYGYNSTIIGNKFIVNKIR